MGELFCGPGGMALGAKMAIPQVNNGIKYSINHLWGVDNNIYAIETYNNNNLGTGIQCDALDFVRNQKTNNNKVLSDFRKNNALAFGFPCNDYSLVGEKKGFQGKYGNLYKAGIEAINYSNPLWFVAENVSGIHSANSGKAFKGILKELSNAGQFGYNISVHLYKFEDYGVPQYRHRYIIVGIRKDKKFEYKVPAPTHKNKHISVDKALSKQYSCPILNNEKTKQNKQVIERLLFIPPWENAWFLDELLKLTPYMRREALKESFLYDKMIKNLSDIEIERRISECKLNCKKARMSHIYRRLDPNKPSYTITGSGGGGTHVYHWKECRALTNRERARLQSFPDSFIFKGPKEQIRKQIGMAVPPLAAKLIFESILKTFAGIEYHFINPNYKFNNEG